MLEPNEAPLGKYNGRYNHPLTDAELRKLDELLTRFWLNGPDRDGKPTNCDGNLWIEVRDSLDIDHRRVGTAAVVNHIRRVGRRAMAARRRSNRPQGPYKLTPTMVGALLAVADDTGAPATKSAAALVHRGLIHNTTKSDWSPIFELTTAGMTEVERLRSLTAE